MKKRRSRRELAKNPAVEPFGQCLESFSLVRPEPSVVSPRKPVELEPKPTMKSILRWTLLLAVGQAVTTASEGGLPGSHNPQRRAGHRRRRPLAGGFPRSRRDFAQRERWRRRRCRVASPRFLASHARGPPRGPHAVFLDRGRAARTDLRQSRQGKPGQGRQRHELLLSRLQRAVHRCARPADR